MKNPQRVNRKPDAVEVIMNNEKFLEQEFTIHRIELRLYLEKKDENLGGYSLITSFLQTDKGSIEMIYDEGFRGEGSLKRAAVFLTTTLGVSGLVLRSIISLRDHLKG